MDLLLADKTALVVAASKGIGKGAARALAREGCRVIITSSNGDNLRIAKEEIESQTARPISTLVMDLCSHDAQAASCRKILTDFQRIDILVTNSPGPTPIEAIRVERAAWMNAIQANLLSVIELCTTFLPPMIANRFGRIINLTSSTGKEPDESMVLSNVTRAGVLAYSKTLAREVGRYGITVNSILTGSVMTERAKTLLHREAEGMNLSFDELLEQAAKSIPAGYISTPEQFCNTIAFLASPLSMYVNGVSLPIDGGSMKSI